MRIAEMKPNTEYATCDGMLVMTGETVESGWFQFSESVEEKGKRRTVERIAKGDPRKAAEKPDPWADCRPSGRQGIRIYVNNGIRVTQWGFDRNGQRLADGLSVARVMKPADIPGLWSDYVLLHGDVIADKYLRKDLEAEATEWRAETRKALARVGIPVDDGQSVASRALREGRAVVMATVMDHTEWKDGRYVRLGPPYISRRLEFPENTCETVLYALATLPTKRAKKAKARG